MFLCTGKFSSQTLPVHKRLVQNMCRIEKRFLIKRNGMPEMVTSTRGVALFNVNKECAP